MSVRGRDVQLQERECDLVMKGGITSGVVYPRAITRIAAAYRLRNIGGASAGAIAAVAAGACEYRRENGAADAFGVLDEIGDEISKPGFVERLFQPTARARPAFRLALDAVTSTGSSRRRLFAAAVSVLRARTRFLVGATLAVLVWAIVVALVIAALASGGGGSLAVVSIVLVALVAVPVAVLLVAATALVALLRFAGELNNALKTNWFGMCGGRTEEGYLPDSALTDWLYATIQRCAGLPVDRPLTFADLRGADDDDPRVNLQLITTDLSASRPVILPLELPDETPYLFDPDELRSFFPEPVVEQMVRASTEGGQPVENGGRRLYAVPGPGLPIVVAARLSLSFPILLATVPLWRADGPDGDLVRHTMSDGGICSNFPIHFFDSLFPGRPTFGLDLQPWRISKQSAVEMSDEPRRPGFSRVDGVATFFTQILNAARNWRDNMQSELPGYRDRICQIRLTAQEGGLNLTMPDDVVESLVRRGDEAGQRIASGETFDWDRHRVTRFLILMQMLQRSLGARGVGRLGVYRGAYPGRVAFKTVVEAWQDSGASPVDPPPLQWWTQAIPASDAILDLAERWAAGGAVDFDESAPTPTPTLRIIPRI